MCFKHNALNIYILNIKMELPLPEVYFETFDSMFSDSESSSEEVVFEEDILWSEIESSNSKINSNSSSNFDSLTKQGWDALTSDEILKIYDNVDINTADENDLYFCNFCLKDISDPQIWHVYDGIYKTQLCSVKCLIKFKQTV